MEADFLGNRDYRQPGNDYMGWDLQSSDPDLSEILDQVIDIVPESIAGTNAFTKYIKKNSKTTILIFNKKSCGLLILSLFNF